MLRRKDALTLEQELRILQVWAHGMDIFKQFSPETIVSVPGLSEALEAVFKLPPAIGWGDDDELPFLTKRSSRKNGKSRSR